MLCAEHALANLQRLTLQLFRFGETSFGVEYHSESGNGTGRARVFGAKDAAANVHYLPLQFFRLGELAMEVLGAPSMVAQNDLDDWQRLFLFTRAETIYGGSDEIQRNIIATRALGLPRPQNP